MNNDMKFDVDKNRLDLIDVEFIEDIGKVLTFGAKKYHADSWKELADAENRYFAATMRHLIEYRKGQDKDPETGLSHLVHAATNLMFLAHFERKENDCSSD